MISIFDVSLKRRKYLLSLLVGAICAIVAYVWIMWPIWVWIELCHSVETKLHEDALRSDLLDANSSQTILNALINHMILNSPEMISEEIDWQVEIRRRFVS